MPQKITINSTSSGKFERRQINNREHIVTSMVSVVGDTVMNRLRYPFDQILNSFKQLSELHAPASHPVVDGQNISAFHPLAVNAFGVGGMVSNPVMDGPRVINDLIFDVEIAEKDDRGKEIIRRIEAGEKIGVSTGLNADRDNKPGMLNGEKFDSSLSNIQFDHVAILLNATPAGKETFTINSDITICNLAESVSELEEKAHMAVRQRFGEGSWVSEILLNPDRIIVRTEETLLSVAFGYNDSQEIVFTGEPIPVERKVSFVPLDSPGSITNQDGVDDMDLEKFVLALIANAGNSFTNTDKDKLNAMSETGLAAILSNAEEVTLEAATIVVEKAGSFVNTINAEQAADFVANADSFKEYQDAQAATRKVVSDLVVNSGVTQDDADKMSLVSLQSMASKISPDQNYSVNAAQTTNAGGATVLKLHESA